MKDKREGEFTLLEPGHPFQLSDSGAPGSPTFRFVSGFVPELCCFSVLYTWPELHHCFFSLQMQTIMVCILMLTLKPYELLDRAF